MKKLNKTLLLFVALISFTSISQTTEAEAIEIANSGSEQEVLMHASTLMSGGYLHLSEILTDKLIEFQPESSNYNYRKGFLTLYIRKDYQSALPILRKLYLILGIITICILLKRKAPL